MKTGSFIECRVTWLTRQAVCLGDFLLDYQWSWFS